MGKKEHLQEWEGAEDGNGINKIKYIICIMRI